MSQTVGRYEQEAEREVHKGFARAAFPSLILLFRYVALVCFVASLLTLAHRKINAEDPEQYELWIVFKEQANILRKQIDTETSNENIAQPFMRISLFNGPIHRTIGQKQWRKPVENLL